MNLWNLGALVACCWMPALLSAQSAPAPYLWFSYTNTWGADTVPADILTSRVRVLITTPSTYYETLGWNFGAPGGGYSGIQDSGTLGKNYIFLLWIPITDIM